MRPRAAGVSSEGPLDHAARLFEAQRFFEAHEVLEAVWRSPDLDPRDRAFWRGVTQVAVGWCHAQRGNAAGAARLLERAVRNLAPYPSPHHGVDTSALVGSARTGAAAIREHGAVPPPPYPGLPLARGRGHAGGGTPPRRIALLALGWIFFALGAVGTVLPLVPTTPFMLLALWAFSASSARFHRWLYEHRVFGPPLQRFRRDRVVPRWTKALAIGSMSASLAYAGLVERAPWYGLLAMAAVMIAGVLYISRFPSRPRPAPGGTAAAPAHDRRGTAPRG